MWIRAKCGKAMMRWDTKRDLLTAVAAWQSQFESSTLHAGGH